MTLLNDEQHELLARIEALYERRKQVRDEVLAELDVEAAVEHRTGTINDLLYADVRRAIESGVPKRKIGTAIGTTNFGTYDQLVRDALEILPDTVQDGSATGVAVVKRRGDKITVTLRDYVLNHELITDKVAFNLVDGEWLVDGDRAVDYAVERAILGAEPNVDLQAEFLAVSE